MASLGARSKTGKIKVHRAEDMSRAFELRTRGLSQRAIAADMGCSLSKVNDLLQAGIKEHPVENIDAHRQVMAATLDLLIEAHLPLACGQATPEDTAAGIHVVPDTDSANVVIKAIDRKSKLFGADAATKTELTGKDGGHLAVDFTTLTDAQLEQLSRGILSPGPSESGIGDPETDEAED